ncbi:MAG: putative glycosyltransferase [Gammaproteobacteria bacterium]|jgi:predicted glycosyltransferase
MSTGHAARILIYSHDSFGLGHLRRCRTLAEAIVNRYPNVSVLILTGSPIIGSFEFPTRVDFVRVPGVIKLRNGEYSSLSLHMDLGEVLELRASIIRHTALAFHPDVFIVDKEPLGLRGEIAETLQELRSRGTRLILGLRDVMDDPKLLAKEWSRKNPVPALRDLYHQIWVYGLETICAPLAGLELPDVVLDKLAYTGYIGRRVPANSNAEVRPVFEAPFILVTAGGGGDGVELVDRVLRAYEFDAASLPPALVVFGPFMPSRWRDKFRARAEPFANLEVTTFDARLEALMARAVGVVAMGGYNTFCEILSFDKPALILPRRKPRMEQYIRAARAQELGLIKLVPERDPDRVKDARRMAQALAELPSLPLPSTRAIPGLLAGVDNIGVLLDAQLEEVVGPLPQPTVALPER